MPGGSDEDGDAAGEEGLCEALTGLGVAWQDETECAGGHLLQHRAVLLRRKHVLLKLPLCAAHLRQAPRTQPSPSLTTQLHRPVLPFISWTSTRGCGPCFHARRVHAAILHTYTWRNPNLWMRSSQRRSSGTRYETRYLYLQFGKKPSWVMTWDTMVRRPSKQRQNS